MLRLRLRPEASSLVVTMTATAARSVSSCGAAPSSISTSIRGNTLIADVPMPNAPIASALRRFTSGHHSASSMMMRRGGVSSSTFVIPNTMITAEQLRFVRAKSSGSDDASSSSSSNAANGEKASAEGEAKGENSNTNSNTNSSEEGAKEGDAEADAKKKKKGAAPKKSFKEQFQALKQDIKEFPDIYNSVNLVHFFIFTIFCLCSTGSNVEEQWWMRNWGIDKTFAPWAWPLHSMLTNNFLSMTFAMLLLHSMCHATMVTIGAKLMWQYMAAVAVLSGASIWGLNYTMGWSHEKQFGPWDVCSALFVMQYLHAGLKPWSLILSFHGWVKYAMCVGSVCILYYDWQPVAFGTGFGLALCKLHPKLRSIKPPV